MWQNLYSTTLFVELDGNFCFFAVIIFFSLFQTYRHGFEHCSYELSICLLVYYIYIENINNCSIMNIQRERTRKSIKQI